jgi:hypothetical protein
VLREGSQLWRIVDFGVGILFVVVGFLLAVGSLADLLSS